MATTANMRNTHLTSSRLLLSFLLAATLLAAGCGQTGDPHTEHAHVDRNKLTVVFSAALDHTQKPASGLFTVTVDGRHAPVESVTVKENTVDLRLRDSVRHDDQVQLSFFNTDKADTQLRAADQTPVSDFAGLYATNNTVDWFLVTVIMVSFVVGLLLVCFFMRDRLLRMPQHG